MSWRERLSSFVGESQAWLSSSLLKATILLFSKKLTLSKQKTISTEPQLRQAAKKAFEGDDLLCWRWKAFELTRKRGVDALLELKVDGRRLLFAVDFKLTPLVREVESVGGARREETRPVDRAIALRVAGAALPRAGLSCADLNGRQWIQAEGVLVDRKPSETRRFRPPFVAL